MEYQEDKIVCICGQDFTEKTILRHLNHPQRKSCKENIGEDRYDQIVAKRNEAKRQYDKTYNKRYKETHGPELRERERINYAENSSPVKKRHKEHYAENKDIINQRRREDYTKSPTNKKKKEGRLR